MAGTKLLLAKLYMFKVDHLHRHNYKLNGRFHNQYASLCQYGDMTILVYTWLDIIVDVWRVNNSVYSGRTMSGTTAMYGTHTVMYCVYDYVVVGAVYQCVS
ncbi:hypothetical protein O5D80_004919 [Batrachochytrium dendrobatidis]|nr:hypothetical protein O5D80_004919 [Batrachochytrium dendrobatidis]